VQLADGDTIPPMNRIHLCLRPLSAVLLLAGALACTQQETAGESASDAPLPESPDQRTSYALGFNIGTNLEPDDLTLDADLVLRGFRDGLERDGALSSDEVDELLGELGAKMQAHKDRQRQEARAENTALGAEYLAAKAEEEGVVQTDSGLLYRELRSGSGDSPTVDQTVTVHYRGSLIDGTVFDSSYDRGQPASFPVGRVIAGWTEAMQLMKPGAKWELFIPSDLGYGANGAGTDIPPGATLVFEVELLEVE